MQWNLFFVVALFGVCVLGQDSSNGTDAENSTQVYNEEDEYTYPCEDTSDIVCVRSFFMSFFQCIAARFDDRQPIYRVSQTVHIPIANVTINTHKDVITFNGSKVEKLYYNPVTSSVVMTVSFKTLKIETGTAYYSISQVGKVPVTAEDTVTVNYENVWLTAVIALSNKLDMRNAKVSAYNYNARPSFSMGPELGNSSNPVVQSAIQAIHDNLPTAVQEIFLTEAYSYFIAYMQSHICYYGILLSG
ncbi:uncharacterized protein LOC114364894 [Ostrinia furnacalis]|uniref:uncharacterized protein LOC114364894 n=1 Tax=Ostrinia furnacalis TaxID=93504 RepID=UPI00103884E4|nr:uncharacterized protein LOC114364894 [Ostrinia furnacalis]